MIILVFCVVRKNLSTTFFFECCVAKLVWDYISELLGLRIGHDFESVARFLLANKKHKVTNTISVAVLWSF